MQYWIYQRIVSLPHCVDPHRWKDNNLRRCPSIWLGRFSSTQARPLDPCSLELVLWFHRRPNVFHHWPSERAWCRSCQRQDGGQYLRKRDRGSHATYHILVPFVRVPDKILRPEKSASRSKYLAIFGLEFVSNKTQESSLADKGSNAVGRSLVKTNTPSLGQAGTRVAEFQKVSHYELYHDEGSRRRCSQKRNTACSTSDVTTHDIHSSSQGRWCLPNLQPTAIRQWHWTQTKQYWKSESTILSLNVCVCVRIWRCVCVHGREMGGEGYKEN